MSHQVYDRDCMSVLKEICKPIKQDLVQYKKEFRALLKSNVYLLDKVVQYFVSNNGKHLRPILVILTSKLHNDAILGQRELKAAAIMELLHTATLIHNNVIDDSHQRRTLPAINSTWKNKVSVLMGGYLFSKALLTMLNLKSMRAYKIVSETAERMSEGELLGVERSNDYWMDEEVYYRLISDKTASLLAASCQLGAVSATENEEDIAAMKEFGENLGIAFQIRDDLMDIFGREKRIRKPMGSDIRDSTIPLPLLHALQTADRKESRRILGLLKKNKKRQNIQEVVSFVETHEGVEYANKKADEYVAKAITTLNRYPDSPYKESLRKLVSFVTYREN